LNLPQGIKVAYRYDNASRLTNITYYAAVTNKIDYAYDATGNRVSQNSVLAIYNLPSAISNSVYNAANQQLTFGSYSILYDSSGNVTNIVSGTTTNRLLWSSRNQLTNMLGAVTASFVYDGLGRRRQRVVSGTTENYLYDGLDIILQKTAAGAVGARYLRGLGIDEPWQRTDIGAANTNRVYLADALGSIVALADTNKVIQTEYDYEPFGNTTTTGSANKNSYKFTAREDDGTGLYYYRARYYHPALGRFVSEDLLEFVNGPNLYSYVENNPMTYVDSLGLAKSCFDEWLDCYTYEKALNDIVFPGLGTALAGGGLQGLNKSASKPRKGVAGGGPSGDYTSYTRRWYGELGKRIGRAPISAVMKRAGILGAGVGALALHFECLQAYIECENRKCGSE
jgi:RHS repeat-associated protein